jgi:hypothetical protein
MKLLFISLLFLFSMIAFADKPTSQYNRNSASLTTNVDLILYSNMTAHQSQTLTIWDLVNLPPFVSTYAPIANATLTGVTSTSSLSCTNNLNVGGTIAAVGKISATANANALLISPATLSSSSYAQFTNTGGTSYVGVEGGAGNVLTPDSAYDLAIVPPTGHNLVIGYNGGSASALKVDSSGLINFIVSGNEKTATNQTITWGTSTGPTGVTLAGTTPTKWLAIKLSDGNTYYLPLFK